MSGLLEWSPEETREEYINRIAYNRFEIRIMSNGRIKGDALSDRIYAENLVNKEEKKQLLDEKSVTEKLKEGGY